MGVLPLMFKNGMTWKDLKLDGTESISILGISNIKPQQSVECLIYKGAELKHKVDLLCRVDTEVEVSYINNGGILQYVLRKLST
jgi:aconitate hydratase